MLPILLNALFSPQTNKIGCFHSDKKHKKPPKNVVKRVKSTQRSIEEEGIEESMGKDEEVFCS